jgi:WW domain
MSARPTESTPERSPLGSDSVSATRESSLTIQGEGDVLTSEARDSQAPEEASRPPLPDEAPPPLPTEAPPGQVQDDDGWDPVWDENAQLFYFFNRYTKISQWENPRIPSATEPAPPGVGNHDRLHHRSPERDTTPTKGRLAGGYDPAIHGNYDPNADYAKAHHDTGDTDSTGPQLSGVVDSAESYAATGTFNRYTGRWQAAALNPDNFNDENKSRRQMTAYFDVDSAANSHDGKSLKAERSGKKLSKKEVKAFKDKRRERKEEKRRAWLRD